MVEHHVRRQRHRRAARGGSFDAGVHTVHACLQRVHLALRRLLASLVRAVRVRRVLLVHLDLGASPLELADQRPSLDVPPDALAHGPRNGHLGHPRVLEAGPLGRVRALLHVRRLRGSGAVDLGARASALAAAAAAEAAERPVVLQREQAGKVLAHLLLRRVGGQAGHEHGEVRGSQVGPVDRFGHGVDMAAPEQNEEQHEQRVQQIRRRPDQRRVASIHRPIIPDLDQRRVAVDAKTLIAPRHHGRAVRRHHRALIHEAQVGQRGVRHAQPVRLVLRHRAPLVADQQPRESDNGHDSHEHTQVSLQLHVQRDAHAHAVQIPLRRGAHGRLAAAEHARRTVPARALHARRHPRRGQVLVPAQELAAEGAGRDASVIAAHARPVPEQRALRGHPGVRIRGWRSSTLLFILLFLFIFLLFLLFVFFFFFLLLLLRLTPTIRINWGNIPVL
mmetsp:Transcript_4076/g.13110  ORF Transcript_4076/g.13110 Transcript_4076/m.13110 type:complete len:448 (+) Transcript_4076:2545-3888(+)